jgi:hypothetical protein
LGGFFLRCKHGQAAMLWQITTHGLNFPPDVVGRPAHNVCLWSCVEIDQGTANERQGTQINASN